VNETKELMDMKIDTKTSRVAVLFQAFSFPKYIRTFYTNDLYRNLEKNPI